MSFHPMDDKKLKKKKNGESVPLEAHCFLGLRLISFYIMNMNCYAFKKQNKWDCGRTFYEKLIIYIFKLFLYFYSF
jgi:hypothetical protein